MVAYHVTDSDGRAGAGAPASGGERAGGVPARERA